MSKRNKYSSLLLGLLGICVSAAAAAGELDLKFEFSTDGGKTFKEESPVLERPGTFVLRTHFVTDVADDQRPVYQVEFSARRDFASANKGSLATFSGKGTWAQRPNPYWLESKMKSFDLTVDTQARPEGVEGYQDTWDTNTNKFVNGKLPACTALPRGKTEFTMLVFWSNKDGGKVEARKSFNLEQKSGPDIQEVQKKAVSVERKPLPAAQRENVIISAAKLAEIFVSPSGKDDNPGTKELPFRSIAKALGAVSADGTINLAEGIYREGNLMSTQSGTAGKPVLIEGAGRDKTIIKGSLEVKNWESSGNGSIWKTAWDTNSQQVFCDGKPLQQIGETCGWHTKVAWAEKLALPPVGKGLDDLKPGSFFYDGAAGQLYVMLEKKDDPRTHLMEASVMDWVLSGKGTEYVTMRNLSLMHCNGSRIGTYSVMLTTGKSHWTVEDCRIEYGDFGGLSAGGKNHRIVRCIISNNGNNGVAMNNSDAAHGWAYYPTAPRQDTVVEDCEISGNNYRNFQAAWHSGGLKLIPASRGVTVRRCIVKDNNGPGIWFDNTIGENTIEDNLCDNNTAGIFYEISKPSEDCAFSAIIRNNRIVRSREQGIYVSASSGVLVENNTVYDSWVGIAVHGMPRGKFKLADNTVQNNIIMGRSHADAVIFVGDNATNNTMDGNFYVTGPASTYSKNGLRVCVVKGQGYDITDKTLESLRVKGYEKNGLEGDPMWVNAAAFDFQLKPDSPAAGKGWRKLPAVDAAK